MLFAVKNLNIYQTNSSVWGFEAHLDSAGLGWG
jgi:hypothetical protein